MNLTDTQLKRLQEMGLDIFREFVRICEHLGLRYYLLGGTMLGAVRHEGFIPWDDDIDVGMLREDYEIFMKEAGKLLPEHIFLQNHHTDKEYHSNAAKLRNSNTTFIETSIKNSRINHGIFVDVFPLDYYPDTYLQRIWLEVRKRIISMRVGMVYEKTEPDPLWKKLIKRMLTWIYPTVNSAVNARERLYLSVGKSKRLVNHNGAWGKKEIVPAEWYAEEQQVQFEGITVTIPKEYDRCLTQLYGNYMQLPPVEKRVPRHSVVAIDFEKSYTEYMK